MDENKKRPTSLFQNIYNNLFIAITENVKSELFKVCKTLLVQVL